MLKLQKHILQKLLSLALIIVVQQSFSQSFSKPNLFEATTIAKDSFWVECGKFTSLPQVFQKGYVMIYRREEPGSIFLLDTKGNVVWSHESKATGYKVVRYTKTHTLLCITGTKENEIGYGNSIVELSLTGDTLFYLKKGQGDFQHSVHHEILVNSKNQIVVLTRDEKILDLSSKGGAKKDTVFGDGILVLDRKGNQLWKWSVFDKLNPMLDENILKTKKDWTHANSIAFDRDGNYLVSFYNNGQVWKVNATTGSVMWKLGKGGDFEIPRYAVFDQAHAAHINSKGWLMLFDNGGNKRISRSLAFHVDGASKKAQPVINVWLPPPLYTDRMGSTYLVNDTSLLVCISRHKIVALSNLQGSFLWKLNTNRIQSYRAEFIRREQLEPYLPKSFQTIITGKNL